MATVGDLFDELNGESSTPEYDNTQLVESKPDQIIAYDANNQKVIIENTTYLKTSLEFCERIVIAAYNVAEYVPDLRNDQHLKFWKEDVIPNLVKSLTQDVKARTTIIRSFATIRDLGITIQKASEIVQQSKGSPKAIEIAKKNIPAALNKLDKCIEEASSLENTAINTFANQTKQLFEIIGPKAANFVEQKAEIEVELNKIYEKQKGLYSEIGELQGELNALEHLISATREHLYGIKEDMEQTKSRIEELNQLNSKIEQTLQNIPTSNTKTITTCHGGFWWWGLGRTTTTHESIENRNRDAEKFFYESMIIARKARVRDNQDDAESKERVVKDLTICLGDYEKKYKKAKKALEILNSSLSSKMAGFQSQIDILNKKTEDKSQSDIEGMIGLRGKTLIDCLVEVRAYSRTIKQGASAYSPLVSILTGIKSIVESDVELLSGSRTDVFLAGSRLMKLVGFLGDYSINTRQVLEVSNEFRSLAIKD